MLSLFINWEFIIYYSVHNIKIFIFSQTGQICCFLEESAFVFFFSFFKIHSQLRFRTLFLRFFPYYRAFAVMRYNICAHWSRGIRKKSCSVQWLSMLFLLFCLFVILIHFYAGMICI